MVSVREDSCAETLEETPEAHSQVLPIEYLVGGYMVNTASTKDDSCTEALEDTQEPQPQVLAKEDACNKDAVGLICCSWFQWFETSTYFSSVCQEIPFRLSFDADIGRYVIKRSPLRRKIWAAFQIIGAVVFFSEVAGDIQKIRSLHDDMLYFELLNSLSWLMYDYGRKFIWLCRMDRVQEFFDELQDSPLLLKLAPKKSKAVQLFHATVVAWYLSTTFMFFPTRWGVFDWTLANYYRALQSACELYFGISKAHEDEFWYPIMIFITFFLTSFEYNTMCCGDMLAVAGILTMKSVAFSIDGAMRTGILSDEEVYDLMRAQKRLTRKFNRAFGLLVCMYVTYSSPYYSLHFVDMIQTPGLMNQLSMVLYLTCLLLSCKWAIDILILAKRRKRWLVRQNRILSFDLASANVTLDDISWEKFGLGGYFEVNAFVAGQVFSLIATVAIVIIQHPGRDS